MTKQVFNFHFLNGSFKVSLRSVWKENQKQAPFHLHDLSATAFGKCEVCCDLAYFKEELSSAE